MIPGLQQDDIVSQTPSHIVYRRRTLVGLSLHGDIDDERSNAWRAALEHEVVRGGFAEFYAIDGCEMVVKNGMGSRLRSALFVRKLMAHARFAAVHARDVRNPTAAMRALLRTAGIGNFVMCSRQEQFASAVEQMLNGQIPSGS